MGLTILDQIAGQGTLGQQGIGRDLPTLEGDGFEQWDGHFDLVGAFDFFRIGYGQGTHFFWV
jgi:hypothetical protein